jgi:large subunit ribosomal protein L6
MSRIGKKPIAVPGGVTVSMTEGDVSVKGPKGELKGVIVDQVIAKLEDGEITIQPANDSKEARSMWGMQRTILNNMVVGVTEGFEIDLEINGVGYRASVQGRTLNLQLGFSHDVLFPIPEGIDIKCATPTQIKVSGIDKQRVGQVAANIRGYRPPEPYKGKGVKYANEYVFRKEGKKK